MTRETPPLQSDAPDFTIAEPELYNPEQADSAAMPKINPVPPGHNEVSMAYENINSTAVQPVDCREAFEKWYWKGDVAPPGEREDDGDYASFNASLAWDAWQAAWKPEGEKDWQPIETAPKDGSSIMIVNSKGRIVIVWWVQDHYLNGSGWMEGQLDELWIHTPSLWMPLPRKPEREK